MQFTILSHAGVLIEHGGKKLVCDPWLIGSCYWRSWWNFPEPPEELITDLRPDYIYLTHLHWDHFHGPSLKKLFDPRTVMIVPKVPTRRMVDDLQWLGFRNIVEVPHGKSIQLGDDFELYSYQFGVTVDSAIVVRGGGATLFNCNDAKFFGMPLHQIMARHPKMDFILRSHSSASPIPYCVENHRTLLPAGDDAEYDAADQFARCALYIGARYAVPFASNHCFLHRETTRFNANVTSPDVAQARYQTLASELGRATHCVVMPPGSRWSDVEGFSIAQFDFRRRDQYIEQCLSRHKDQLERTYSEEAAALPDFDAFKAYFAALLRAIPGPLRRRFLGPVVFRSEDSSGHNEWLVDPIRGEVTALSTRSSNTVVFEVNPKVLNDCVAHRMFAVWGASKRVRIHLPEAASLKKAMLWFTVLDFFELDMLPLRKNLSLRALSVRARRWREAVEATRILLRRLILRQPFRISEIYGKSPDAA
jgi:UDP-MurNAc hydroxylase